MNRTSRTEAGTGPAGPPLGRKSSRSTARIHCSRSRTAPSKTQASTREPQRAYHHDHPDGDPPVAEGGVDEVVQRVGQARPHDGYVDEDLGHALPGVADLLEGQLPEGAEDEQQADAERGQDRRYQRHDPQDSPERPAPPAGRSHQSAHNGAFDDVGEGPGSGHQEAHQSRREGGRHQSPEAVAVRHHPERDHGQGRDRTQMREEPPDHHQGHADPGQHGRGREFDRPQRPGSAGLVRHPSSLPFLAGIRGRPTLTLRPCPPCRPRST